MNLFLDHCIPPSFAPALAALSVKDEHLVVALRDKFPPNSPDEVWLRALAREGDWVVISGDSNIYRNPKRRKIWIRARLTTFFWQPAWNRQRYWDKAWRMVRWWPRILEIAASVEGGTGFSIPYKVGGRLRPI